MLVTELHQVLMDHEMTCQRTCFSLQLGGATLDALMELYLVPGIQEGTLIKVVEGKKIKVGLFFSSWSLDTSSSLAVLIGERVCVSPPQIRTRCATLAYISGTCATSCGAWT